MARGGDFDISVIGDKALARKLKRFNRSQQRKAISPALRDSAKRAKARVIANLSGHPVGVVTGRTLAAFTKAPVRSGARSRGEIRIGQILPDRKDLGIPAEAKHYYPMAIEFGHKRARAYPFMRPAIDNHYQSELSTIGRQIGRNIETRLRRRG